jgi:hypothetical protein
MPKGSESESGSSAVMDVGWENTCSIPPRTLSVVTTTQSEPGLNIPLNENHNRGHTIAVASRDFIASDMAWLFADPMVAVRPIAQKILISGY